MRLMFYDLFLFKSNIFDLQNMLFLNLTFSLDPIIPKAMVQFTWKWLLWAWSTMSTFKSYMGEYLVIEVWLIWEVLVFSF